jgi:N6-adenosine-specific RNA methylase IME4
MTMLVQYDRACAILAEATRVDEVLHVRDEMEHIKLHARQIRDRELMAAAAEFQMRVERRLGKLLVAAKEAGQIAEGRRRSVDKNGTSEVPFPRVTLQEVGVSKKLSAKSQQVASISEPEFEEIVKATRVRVAAGKPINLNPVDEDQQRQNRRNLAQELSDTSAALSATGRKYPCFYADPAWRRKAGEGNRSYENHYRTMTWDEILALPVKDMALPDAWLFLWLPRAHLMALHLVEIDVQLADGEIVKAKVKLPLAWAIAQAWGFDNWSTCFIWTKTDEDHPNDIGTGLVVRDQDEVLCLFKKGRGLPKPASDEKYNSNHRERSKPLGHSRKPDHYRQMIASMTGGLPVLELFARVDAEHPLPKGWDAWGNQSGNDITEITEIADEAAAHGCTAPAPPSAGDAAELPAASPILSAIAAGPEPYRDDDTSLDIPAFLRRDKDNALPTRTKREAA